MAERPGSSAEVQHKTLLDAEQAARLTEALEQLSDDINGLMEIAEQGTLLKEIVEEVRTLRTAIDDVRAEIEWAARNIMQTRMFESPLQVSSMPVDPCDPKWAEKLNTMNTDRVQINKPPQSLSPSSSSPSVSEHTVKSLQKAVTESPIYCCEQPRLIWQGDPVSPSVACEACGYLVADYGNVVDQRAEQKRGFRPAQMQKQLWQDAKS